MLLDRGLLVQEGSSYTPTQAIDELEVPETLHALVAARLDGLEPEERRLLQDACVLGKTFAREAIATLGGFPDADLEPLLGGLVRKEVLSLQADPRSPERGQFSFVQDLLREVAYDTLSKRDRKARHLAAATVLDESSSGHDIAEVVAAHYLAAYESAPDADDAGAIKEKARGALAQAGERAASLAAPEEGQRYYEQAAALSDDPAVTAGLLEQSGRLAFLAGRPDQSRELLERALGIYADAEDSRRAANMSATLAEVDVFGGRTTDAITRLSAAIPALEEGGH
jgi:predicted ATPase